MENKKLINQSLDMHYYGMNLLIFGALFLFMWGIMLALIIFAEVPDQAIFPTVLYNVIIVPFIAYYIYKIYEIKKKPENYLFYEAAPIEMHSTMNRTVYFTVEVKKADGTTFTAETNGVFSTGGFSDSYFGNYFKRNLHILYDETDERIVVIPRSDTY